MIKYNVGSDDDVEKVHFGDNIKHVAEDEPFSKRPWIDLEDAKQKLCVRGFISAVFGFVFLATGRCEPVRRMSLSVYPHT